MACLEMRKTSKWWYGRRVINGKPEAWNLDVEIEGRRPAKIAQRGDRLFEASRLKALAKLNEQLGNPRKVKGNSVPLSGMYEEWEKAPRRKIPQAKHLNSVRLICSRFVLHISKAHPEITKMSQITPVLASDYMAAGGTQGVSNRTYNATLSALKSVFKKLKRKAGIPDNPFEEIVSREDKTQHRIPFTPEELKDVLAAAKSDELCYPLFVTGICTAMRLGDVCCLKWKDVDLDDGFITVKTSKTGVSVGIPIFPLLSELLSSLPRTSDYCFPEAAKMYQVGPGNIQRRLRNVFRVAGFRDDGDQDDGQALPILSDQEKSDKGMAALRALSKQDFTTKVRETMVKVFDLYLKGGTVDTIAGDLKVVKSTVSLHLKKIETVVGFPVVRRRKAPKPKEKDSGDGTKPKDGLRSVNQRGFHAFRATWVTLALTAGVPMEMVRRVTGHTTLDVVLNNYFQPGKDDFRKALQTAMPALLTEGGAPTLINQIRDILKGSTDKTWTQDHERVFALIAKSAS